MLSRKKSWVTPAGVLTLHCVLGQMFSCWLFVSRAVIGLVVAVIRVFASPVALLFASIVKFVVSVVCACKLLPVENNCNEKNVIAPIISTPMQRMISTFTSSIKFGVIICFPFWVSS